MDFIIKNLKISATSPLKTRDSIFFSSSNLIYTNMNELITNNNKMFNKMLTTYNLKQLRSILINKKITVQWDVHEVYQLLSVDFLLGQECRLWPNCL